MSVILSKSQGGCQDPVRSVHWPFILAVLVLVGGMGGALGGAHSLRRQDQNRIEQEFRQVADKVFGRTLREIQLFMEVLDSIRQLHALSDQVSPEAFDEIVRKGMIHQRRILGAYGFAQSIPDSMRRAYEQADGAGHLIVQSDGRGGFTPVSERAEYFPLTYQTPPGGLGVPMGYDFGARAKDREAIFNMTRHGVFALGGSPVGALSGEARELYMFAPIVYPAGPRGVELVGFAIGLFCPERLLAGLMDDLAHGLRVRLEPAEPNPDVDGDGPRPFVRVFSLADQEWRFLAEADPAYWQQERSMRPYVAGAGGAAASAVVAGALLLLAGRSRRIEAMVQRRTAELADANGRLERLMEERRELEDEVLRISGQEKARIGRDLHDSLGQKLTGAMYLFGAYRQQANPAPAAAADQIAATLKEAVSQIRRIARGLAPVALTEEGLPDALRHLAEESARVYGQTIEFYAEREGRPRDVATAEHLHLIAQEALNNAVKHGPATHVVLTLDYDESGGWLSIEDNGRGLDPTRGTDGDGGSGLRIMRHRAEVFGGELLLERSLLGGLKVACRFPAA